MAPLHAGWAEAGTEGLSIGSPGCWAEGRQQGGTLGTQLFRLCWLGWSLWLPVVAQARAPEGVARVKMVTANTLASVSVKRREEGRHRGTQEGLPGGEVSAELHTRPAPLLDDPAWVNVACITISRLGT